PPRRWRAALLLLPAVLVFGGGTLLGTAWAHSHIFSEGDQTMKERHPAWKRSLAGIVLLSTFTVGAEPVPAEAAQNAPQPGLKKASPPGGAAGAPAALGRPAQGEAPAAPDGDDGQMILKVFRLQHRDPEALANIAHMLITGEPLPKDGMGGAGLPAIPGGPRGGGVGPMPGAGGAPGGFAGGVGPLGGPRGAS